MGRDARCMGLLAEGEELLDRFGAALPDPDSHRRTARRVLERLEGERGVYLAAACQCLHIARLLHREERPTPRTVLLGDYFQSRFTALLLRLDAPWLQDAFARFLAGDAARAAAGLPFDSAAFADLAGDLAGRVTP